VTTSGDEPARPDASRTRGPGGTELELLKEYLPRLRAFVRARLDAELRRRESDSDVVQSVCRELLEHRQGFEYRGESQFRGWLFTAALNKVREKVRFHHQPRRGMQREDQAGSSFAPADPHSSVQPSYAALAGERVALLEAALDTLSDGDREVIALARLAGLPIEDVATHLGKTVAAARKQLGRALLRLSAELQRRRAAGDLA
jgi:RNA polymerase sigma factor (sigma-70 family)